MANSFSFKKGRFDLRKVKKSDRLLIGAVNSFKASEDIDDPKVKTLDTNE